MKVENLSGKEITQKMNVVAHVRRPSEPILSCSDWSKNDADYICYGQVEITYTVPDADPHKKALEAIDGKIESLRAEFQHNLDLLVERKQQLLAIGYDKSADDDALVAEAFPEHK